jgi:catechol 2,3-dioxygenase-like lactoylglutathione lyase family enzyme
MVDMKLELVLLPVSDVDRAKTFYEQVGFHLDVDHQASEDFRVVQFTPPGSACSVTFGVGIGTGDPGTVKGTHLVVSDILDAVDELRGRGIEVDGIRHMGPAGWVDGPHPERSNYGSFSGFADPDGNTWVIQEVGHGESREERGVPQG